MFLDRTFGVARLSKRPLKAVLSRPQQVRHDGETGEERPEDEEEVRHVV